MLSEYAGSAKHHTFMQHNDKEVAFFLPLFLDFTDRNTAAFADVISNMHYMNCQTEHQLLKTTKNLFPSAAWQALTGTPTAAVAIRDELLSVACKEHRLKSGNT